MSAYKYPEYSIQPNWIVPEHIKAFTTTRQGGMSHAPYQSYNLAEHVADNYQNVKKNRQQLRRFLPNDPVWLNQIHSHNIVEARESMQGSDADGSYSLSKNQVCVVMTADCLPVLLTNKTGTIIAAVHAGWRGLADGIIEVAVKKIMIESNTMAKDIIAWLGPAIGSESFEIGEDVRECFLTPEFDAQAINHCFVTCTNKEHEHQNDTIKYLANMKALAKIRLSALGIHAIYTDDNCSYKNEQLFYSYRRDGQTGRMATVIWMDK